VPECVIACPSRLDRITSGFFNYPRERASSLNDTGAEGEHEVRDGAAGGEGEGEAEAEGDRLRRERKQN